MFAVGKSREKREFSPTGEVDARLNNIVDTCDVDDADLLRGWRAELAELSERLRGPEVPPEYKQAVDKLVGKLGYAEKKVGSPEFPSIGRAVHDAAQDALRAPHWSADQGGCAGEVSRPDAPGTRCVPPRE